MPGEQEFDTGTGTGGTATMRILGDSSQVATLGLKTQSSSVPVVQCNYVYQYIAAGTSSNVGGYHLGDYLAGIVIIPASLTCGGISVVDGGLTPRTIYQGGATASLSNLSSYTLALGFVSSNGGWSITCGSNVAAIVIGIF